MVDEDRGVVGRWIRETRKRRSQTIEDVARKLGVHRSTVDKWEAGVTRPDAGRAIVLSEWSGVGLAEVLHLLAHPSGG